MVHSSRRLESEIESWWTKSTGYETEFEKGFRRLSRKYGGWENSHLHLNRVFVNGPKYLPATGLGTAKLSLKQKQSLVASVHKNQNYKADLVQRMGCALAIMKSLGTREVLAAIDVAPSCGLKEINAALKMGQRFEVKYTERGDNLTATFFFPDQPASRETSRRESRSPSSRRRRRRSSWQARSPRSSPTKRAVG